MRKVSVVAVVVLLVSVAVSAFAQQWQGEKGGGGRQGGQYRMYDPSKAETVSGEVVAVKEFTSRNGIRKGIGLELNTGSQTILAHLGPRFYIDQQSVKIAVGDKVDITGVKAVIRGQDVFLAGEVRKGGQVLKLRDEKGVPLWAGCGPGGDKRS
jgi:hypothetical protein